MTDDEFLAELTGGLWHTTTPDRYRGILDVGRILPNPQIPDTERWKTSRGPHYYPYARTLNGVSLFDFSGFDPDAYSAKYPMSTWRAFVPVQRGARSAIWIELDRQRVARAYIDPVALLTRQKAEGAFRHTIMPMLEGAHLGPIPMAAVACALQVTSLHRGLVEVHPLSTSRITSA